MVEVVSNLQMGFIHKPAWPVPRFTGGKCHADAVAVRDAELLIVVGRDKPNAVLRVPHMPVKKIPLVAADIEIVIAGIGIQP